MEEKEKPDLDPVDVARLNRKPRKERKGWSQDQQANYFKIKIILSIVIALFLVTCGPEFL